MSPDQAAEIHRRLSPHHLVLDVGGWHAPVNRADWIIDIMPHATRNRAGAVRPDLWPEERFTKDTYVERDLCERGWPFADKQFDFAICSHTLEDLRDPIAVCSEMVRVAKAGYVEVPSRLVESTRGVERPFYCGYYHHRWLCEWDGRALSFQFKPAMIHAYRRFHFRKSFLSKINPRYEATSFFWEGEFAFHERVIIDRNEVQRDLLRFKNTFRGVPDLFVPKYAW